MSFIQKAEAEEERALEDASEPAKNETIANGRDGNLSTQRERERERERDGTRERKNAHPERLAEGNPPPRRCRTPRWS